jgi:hypothetical protein
MTDRLQLLLSHAHYALLARGNSDPAEKWGAAIGDIDESAEIIKILQELGLVRKAGKAC